VGDPTLGRLYPTGEIALLRRLLPEDRLAVKTGFEASREEVERLAPGKAVLYLSTHSQVDERYPARSRIVLSLVGGPDGRAVDGTLRPAQVARLRLDGALVVLSACDSALGGLIDGEGLEGFTQSFFAAGASRLVLSLSKVEAHASEQFFKTFYSGLVGSRPATVEHALRLARQRLADPKGLYRDPVYWASFSVIGRPARAGGGGGIGRGDEEVGGYGRERGWTMITCRDIPPEVWAMAYDALVRHFTGAYAVARSPSVSADDLAQDTLVAILRRSDYRFDCSENFLKVCLAFARNIESQNWREVNRRSMERLDFDTPMRSAGASGLEGAEVATFLQEVLRVGKEVLAEKDWQLLNRATVCTGSELAAEFGFKDAQSLRVYLHRLRKSFAKMVG
jgi:hypothetical protein